MKLEKEDIIKAISQIRDEIGHENIEPDITDIIFNEKQGELLIITSDRVEKSLVIGKGGWVVGKLKEKLKVNQIHVEAYSDIYIRKYRMKLATTRLKVMIAQGNSRPSLFNLLDLLKRRIEHPYSLDAVLEDLEKIESEPSDEHQAVVALSGGVDSSFSLIIAALMGFNPLAVTVDPGSIILPGYFRESVEKLSQKLSVEHRYLEVDMSSVVEGALEGRYHPCGRCSKVIEETVTVYTQKKKIPFLIFGDLLATGAQSLVYRGDVLRINLPAMISATKGETKALAGKYGVISSGAYGCPLLAEVKKKYSHMSRYSIQRVLRETRAGILEPGEARDMIMNLCQK